ncbi:hypothetical protein E2542_SST27007 [Spatholobus suberectus]|nr:hypothetical protein E2542_SST27007 [Spatholobus suberectus]
MTLKLISSPRVSFPASSLSSPPRHLLDYHIVIVILLTSLTILDVNKAIIGAFQCAITCWCPSFVTARAERRKKPLLRFTLSIPTLITGEKPWGVASFLFCFKVLIRDLKGVLRLLGLWQSVRKGRSRWSSFMGVCIFWHVF